MASISLLKGNFGHLKSPTQVDSLGNSPINHALTAVAQEVAEMLQHPYPPQMEHNNHKTIAIRAIEPEYRRVLSIELMTERELEVLQLIVDGYSNGAIAEKLHITIGTVKTHVRNILKKLYADEPPAEELTPNAKGNALVADANALR